MCICPIGGLHNERKDSYPCILTIVNACLANGMMQSILNVVWSFSQLTKCISHQRKDGETSLTWTISCQQMYVHRIYTHTQRVVDMNRIEMIGTYCRCCCFCCTDYEMDKNISKGQFT